MQGRGLPRWWVLPLEMFSTCIYYSRLYWTWFGYVSHSYCTTWPSLILARFIFLLDHVSGPLLFHMLVFYWHTCRVAVGSYVTSLLDHVSYFYWLPVSYSTTRHGAVVCPHFVFLFGHMTWRLPSTCWIFNSPRVVPWLFVLYTGSSTCRIFIWSRGGQSWFYRMHDNN
jgi:hypothetical protein